MSAIDPQEFDINPRVTLVGKTHLLHHSALGVPTSWHSQSWCHQPPMGKSATLEVEPDVAPKPASTPEPRRSVRLRGNVMLLDGDEPATYQDAMGSTDSESWLGAMRSELKSMDDNQVWNLVDLHDGARSI